VTGVASGSRPLRGSHARALLFGTLAVGILDGLDAILFFYLRSDVAPDRIFKGIAAGLLGPSARQGGWGTVLLGIGLHFFISFVVVLVFMLASRRIPILTRRPIVSGLLYGIGVYLVMNFIVLPLSATGRAPFVLPVVVNGVLIHMFGVGLPASLAVYQGTRRKAKSDLAPGYMRR
jgi:hypothetical protein